MRIIRYTILGVRPFHLVNIYSILFLALSTKDLYLFEILEISINAWVMVFLMIPLTLSINDYFHRLDDKQMGRNRYFTITSHSLLIPFSLGLLCFVGLNLIAYSFSFITLILVNTDIIVAILYGYTKLKRLNIASYLLRIIHGLTLFLIFASVISISVSDVLIGLAVGFIDLGVHITGDLRDYDKDLIANLRTLPIISGFGITFLVVIVLMATGGVILALYYDNFVLLIISLGFTALSFLLYRVIHYLFSTRIWDHAIFHGSKQLIYLLSGSLILNILQEAIFGIFIALALWFGFYVAYLFADERIQIK